MSVEPGRTNTRDRVIWITRTAVFMALLISVQFFSAAFGQLVTGSLVNMVLMVAVMTGGLTTGLAVSIAAPFLAFAIGVGIQQLPMIPVIAGGNAVLVLVWHIFSKIYEQKRDVLLVAAIIAAALAKFAVMYFIGSLVLVPLLGLPPRVAQMFSYPQLITAIVGGALGALVLPLVSRAANTGGNQRIKTANLSHKLAFLAAAVIFAAALVVGIVLL